MRRRSLAVAAVAALVGGGIGHQAGISGLGLAPGPGVWIALVGILGLVALLLSPPVRSTDLAADSDDAGWIEFRRELRRARRGGRPLTILRIAGDELSADGADGRSDLGMHARKLGLRLRIVDRTWVDDGSIYVLLPESSRAAADALIARIRADVPQELPEGVRIATFPENGLTSGAIIAALNDGVVDAVPIPIRPMGEGVVDAVPIPIRAIGGDAAAFAPDAVFAPDDELSVGEAAGT
jgi:hypothetical protein